MRKQRRKLSTVLSDFQKEINKLRKFDDYNQGLFEDKSSKLSEKQLHLLSEALFFSAYREYEAFISDCFLLYTLEKPTLSNNPVKSFVKPQNFSHAKALLQSSMRFLEWNSPDTVITRAGTYLKDGFPIRQTFTSNRVLLVRLKKIRNQVAHNSLEAFQEYQKVLKDYYRVIPLVAPSVGKYLLLKDNANSSKYLLQTYFDFFISLSNEVTENPS